MLNKFGGAWTEDKIDIVEKYTRAYLKIMHKQYFKLIYFDGFAGCGDIEHSNDLPVIEGAAVRILSIDDPRSFNIYYLVELDSKKASHLNKVLKDKFPNKKDFFVIEADCNRKLVDLANFLKKNKYHRALAFVDPQGMQVNWSSMSVFNGVDIDMWILIPTGIGVNRLLTKSGDISEKWMDKLSGFFGITEEEIKNKFYFEKEDLTLFGTKSRVTKFDKSVARITEIYSEKLATVWKYVSKPHTLKNTKGSAMFHLILASQNPAAQKIANSIISKY